MKARKLGEHIMSKDSGAQIHQDHENRITRLEVVVENINQTLIRLETKMDHGFDHVNSRFDALNARMDEGFRSVNNRIWHNFYWAVAGFAGVLAMIARSQHWI